VKELLLEKEVGLSLEKNWPEIYSFGLVRSFVSEIRADFSSLEKIFVFYDEERKVHILAARDRREIFLVDREKSVEKIRIPFDFEPKRAFQAQDAFILYLKPFVLILKGEESILLKVESIKFDRSGTNLLTSSFIISGKAQVFPFFNQDSEDLFNLVF